jgi:hypothetical protein
MPEWSLSDIPGSVVFRAQQQEDSDFALQLLNADSREDALSGLGLSDEQLRELRLILDEVARMSFQDAIQQLLDQVGVSMK